MRAERERLGRGAAISLGTQSCTSPLVRLWLLLCCDVEAHVRVTVGQRLAVGHHRVRGWRSGIIG
ncbi:hypothetical protein EYF80_045650 [Liparis tanakae]|uniref:Uncharacterized protein n=1 Tax=Liparis tanakae TaxID=230148 RepID=A0A4Z2FTH9_9TELE|nr:hypothetical protein EYF80_045650 [Liparis tanakae]